MDVHMDVHRDVHMDVHMDVHNLGLENYFFSKVLGIVFFDPKSLSIDLLVMVPDFFEITFDRFFSTSGNGPKRTEMDKKCQNKKIEKNVKKYFSKVGGIGP